MMAWMSAQVEHWPWDSGSNKAQLQHSTWQITPSQKRWPSYAPGTGRPTMTAWIAALKASSSMTLAIVHCQYMTNKIKPEKMTQLRTRSWSTDHDGTDVSAKGQLKHDAGYGPLTGDGTFPRCMAQVLQSGNKQKHAWNIRHVKVNCM